MYTIDADDKEILLMLTYLFRNDIPQLDILQTTNGRCTVIVHELVKGVELHHPQEELA